MQQNSRELTALGKLTGSLDYGLFSFTFRELLLPPALMTMKHLSKANFALSFRSGVFVPRCLTLPSSLSFLLSPLILCLFLAAGCTKPEPIEDKPVERPLEGMKLQLAIADDPALAAAIMRQRGEWNAQTGAELEIVETTEHKLSQAEALPADAVLCPSHLLGVLAERKLLAPVPSNVLQDASWGDIFELPRLREAAWQKQIMAVPFGSPVFVCCYRADLLEKLQRRPPRTWAEYQDLAKLLAEKGKLEKEEKHPWAGTIEPLAPDWAGLTLLARTASYAKHPDNYSTLFNIDTMEPMIAGPPFVQALEELVAAAKLGPSNPLGVDPAAARTAFLRGETGMALTWPTAAQERNAAKNEMLEKQNPAKGAPQIRIGFCELPGSPKVFNAGSRVWDDRTDENDSRVPLLAISGRLGVVSAKSNHVDAAFQLLVWLSDDRMSTQTSAASPFTTLFRKSHLKSPSQWVEKTIPAPVAVQYANATDAAMRHVQWLGALRIPGRAQYLAALNEAVVAAVQGKKPAMDALSQADAQWRKITERLGLEKQKSAYRHSLGLE